MRPRLELEPDTVRDLPTALGIKQVDGGVGWIKQLDELVEGVVFLARGARWIVHELTEDYRAEWRAVRRVQRRRQPMPIRASARVPAERHARLLSQVGHGVNHPILGGAWQIGEVEFATGGV